MISYYKKPGETPLQALDRLRAERPELKDEKLSYAGRLDPLAEGELLVLVGEENKDREKYLGLDKTYIVDILFGISTDTGDVLGKITHTKNFVKKDFDGVIKTLPEVLSSLVGTREQKYPNYSSKTHKGKQLHEYAREGIEISEDEHPVKDVTIYGCIAQNTSLISTQNLKKLILEKIQAVSGDFRQEEIVELWNTFFSTNNSLEFLIAKIKVDCSSGTYMRVLAEEVGKKFDVPALAFHIKREKIHIKTPTSLSDAGVR